MRFLSLIKINERAGQQPSERLMTDMGKLLAEMTADGSLIDTAGLRPSAEGARMRLSKGKQTTTDGPFTEAKEVVGGFLMMKADSMAEALKITERFLHLHGDEWEIEVEVRPVNENCGP